MTAAYDKLVDVTRLGEFLRCLESQTDGGGTVVFDGAQSFGNGTPYTLTLPEELTGSDRYWFEITIGVQWPNEDYEDWAISTITMPYRPITTSNYRTRLTSYSQGTETDFWVNIMNVYGNEGMSGLRFSAGVGNTATLLRVVLKG